MKIADIEIDMNEVMTEEGCVETARRIGKHIGIPEDEMAAATERLKEMIRDIATKDPITQSLSKIATYIDSVQQKLSALVGAITQMAQTLDSGSEVFRLGQWNSGLIYSAGVLHTTADAMKEMVEERRARKAEAPTEAPPAPEPPQASAEN